MIKVNSLHHAGIIATNKCTAACRHCLYASSPERSGGYIKVDKARSISAALRTGGCFSVHIGGGEPFIDFDGLIELIHMLSNAGITIEYVETNAFWVDNGHSVKER